MTVHFVKINHVGLKYNSWTKKVSDDQYLEGRYFMGIGTNFAQYPTTKITFEFADLNKNTDADVDSISAWTVNGQTISL